MAADIYTYLQAAADTYTYLQSADIYTYLYRL